VAASSWFTMAARNVAKKQTKHRRVAIPDPVLKHMLVVCKGKNLGLKVRQLNSGIVIIKAFHDSADGEMGPVEAHGECEIGDALLTVSEESIEFLTYKALLGKIKKAPRPMTLRFGKWDGPVEGEEEDGEGDTPKAPIQPLKIYTSKDVAKTPFFRSKQNQRRFCIGIIGVLMLISWYIGARQTTGASRSRETIQSMLNKFVRIRGHGGKENVTVKVIGDEEGVMTLDLKMDDTVIKSMKSHQSKGVRKRRHHKEQERKQELGADNLGSIKSTTVPPQPRRVVSPTALVNATSAPTRNGTKGRDTS
jgi:hypothetical protein